MLGEVKIRGPKGGNRGSSPSAEWNDRRNRDPQLTRRATPTSSLPVVLNQPVMGNSLGEQLQERIGLVHATVNVRLDVREGVCGQDPGRRQVCWGQQRAAGHGHD